MKHQNRSIAVMVAVVALGTAPSAASAGQPAIASYGECSALFVPRQAMPAGAAIGGYVKALTTKPDRVESARRLLRRMTTADVHCVDAQTPRGAGPSSARITKDLNRVAAVGKQGFSADLDGRRFGRVEDGIVLFSLVVAAYDTKRVKEKRAFAAFLRATRVHPSKVIGDPRLRVTFGGRQGTRRSTHRIRVINPSVLHSGRLTVTARVPRGYHVTARAPGGRVRGRVVSWRVPKGLRPGKRLERWLTVTRMSSAPARGCLLVKVKDAVRPPATGSKTTKRRTCWK